MTARAATTAALLLLAGAACGGGDRDPVPEAHAAPGSAARPGPAAAAKAPAPPAPPAPPGHAAYSLVDNRLAAHVGHGGGLVVVGGSAGFAKYMRFGSQLGGTKMAWQLRAREGDAAVAKLTGKSGTVFFPLTAAQAARPALRLRVHAPHEGKLKARVNEGKPIAAELAEGWSTVELAIPAGQLREGENAIELEARGLALAWLQVGAETPLPDDASLALYDAAGGALTVPAGGALSWYVHVPADARLVADVSGEGCAIRARASAGSGAVVQGTLAGSGRGVELGALAGQAVRIDLEAAGCPSVQVAGAALAIPGDAPEVKRGKAPKHVLFVILDSMRFDRGRVFVPGARAETPVLEALAKTGTLFANHYVQGNESQVSHASMWTSMYLAKHKAMKWQNKLPARYVILDEVAQRGGLYAVGATGNGYIRKSRGFGTAWRQYANHIEDELGLRADAIIAHGLSFLQGREQAPWLLYLGLIDTHVPWRAQQPWIERYDPGYKGRFAKSLADQNGFPKDLTAREKEHVRALYDSNVSYLDAQLGELVATLKKWGVWDDTMLIVTADHGDELWEDGRAGHAGGQDDTLLHVPLFVHYPPLFPAGRIATATEGIDILPTIADALGVPADEGWQGASLIPIAQGAEPYPGIATSSGYELQHGARLGAWKLRLAGTRTPALFDLKADPDELTDVFGAPAAIAGGRAVLDPLMLLRAQHADWHKARWGNAGNVTARYAADQGE